MKRKHKILAIALSCVILVTGAISGAIAYLTHQTTEKENVFVVGDINLILEESDNLDLTLIPGTTIKKDPVITVNADSVDCYVFVTVKKTENFDKFATYSIANGWTEYTGTRYDALDKDCDVYYRTVSSSTTDQPFTILANNKVTVKNFDKSIVASYGTTQPKLTFTGYAVQKEGCNSPEAAWRTIYNESVPQQ